MQPSSLLRAVFKRIPPQVFDALAPITISLLIHALIFRDLIQHLSTHLTDLYDYPLYLWILYQNISHITTFNFSHFFDGNIFWPNTGTLLFSDLLLPQTGLALIYTLFTTNKILVFNLVFLSTLVLNVLAISFFWSKIFQKQRLRVFATTITSFFPFLFTQLSHFQMIQYWIFFIALAILVDRDKTTKKALILGLLITAQFISAVYLAIFLLIIIALKFSVEFFHFFVSKSKIPQFSYYAFVAIVFFVTVSPFAFPYIQIKKMYNITRSYGEYVTYAAHITDYVFIPFETLATKAPFYSNWNARNKHTIGERASSSGFVVLFLAIGGFFICKLSHKAISVSFSTKEEQLFFTMLLLAGLFFSLGPQLQVNGQFVFLPLPYAVVMKIIPIVEPLRATARWSLLFYIGTTYFATVGIQKIFLLVERKTKKSSRKELIKNTVLTVILLAALTEIVPTSIRAQEYKQPELYDNIASLCNDDEVLLELPFNQTSESSTIITNLSYKSTMMIGSLDMQCNLVNGYSGYQPDAITLFDTQLMAAIANEDRETFEALLRNYGVTLLKINKDDMGLETRATINAWYPDKLSSSFTVLHSNESQIILDIVNE